MAVAMFVAMPAGNVSHMIEVAIFVQQSSSIVNEIIIKKVAWLFVNTYVKSYCLSIFIQQI